MSAKELRQKPAADLQKELIELRREQFNLRMARATGQAAKPDQFTKVRRNIARLKTVMAEQRRAAPPADAQKGK
jgi:large subunit ribosomal protein L29